MTEEVVSWTSFECSEASGELGLGPGPYGPTIWLGHVDGSVGFVDFYPLDDDPPGRAGFVFYDPRSEEPFVKVLVADSGRLEVIVNGAAKRLTGRAPEGIAYDDYRFAIDDDWPDPPRAGSSKPMPEIEKAKLTFAAVMGLLNAMLDLPSRGNYQQFIVAALLAGRVEQAGTKQRVVTKPVVATDESSGTAADVQVRSGNLLDDAYEVTANDWVTKLGDADEKFRRHDPPGMHILARVRDIPEMIDELRRQPLDISAVDLTAFVSVLVAELRRQSRAAVLRRLYELLNHHDAGIDLVNRYVDLLVEHGLTL